MAILFIVGAVQLTGIPGMLLSLNSNTVKVAVTTSKHAIKSPSNSGAGVMEEEEEEREVTHEITFAVIHNCHFKTKYCSYKVPLESLTSPEIHSPPPEFI